VRREGRGLRALALAVAVLSAPGAAKPPAMPLEEGAEVELSSDLRIRVRSGRDLELEVRAAKGETYADVARRVTGSDAGADEIAAYNGRADLAGRFARVPFPMLSPEYRSLVLLRLFPSDRREGGDWIHLARSGLVSTYGEGLWQIALWFTGDGARFSDVQRANGLASPDLAAGQAVRIPAEMLDPALAGLRATEEGSLQFGTDERGRYAGYRLRAKEALYSAVVVRFTGRTDPDDVHTVAREIGDRSGIRDLTDIPIGFLVKIPLDLLEPEYLPEDDARRIEAEKARAELAAELARRPVRTAQRSLQGVVVILDPGHGGRDLGTMSHGVWEHDYVYDVACRLRKRLQETTSARVYMTLEDEKTGFTPSTGDRLTANHEGTIRTTPPFVAREVGESVVGVNLRWYLANSIFRHAIKSGMAKERVVFISVHADSLHPSLRGAMAYIPGGRYVQGTYEKKGPVYAARAEVRERARMTEVEGGSHAGRRRLRLAMIAAERRMLIRLRDEDAISDEVLRGLEQELDLEAVRAGAGDER